jgi:serine phosphatase RsbU (regulator of sigma subunit)
MKAKVIISGPGPSREVPLDPAGVVIGRDPACGVVLASAQISWRHARIYRDPFGRWIVEDLGSRNGVHVAGEKIKSRPVASGDRISIYPFTLQVSEGLRREIQPDPGVSMTTTTLAEDEPTAGLVQAEAGGAERLSGNRLRQLNAVMDRLAGVATPGDLYPELCRCVAMTQEALVCVLRLQGGGPSPAPAPEMLAVYLAGREEKDPVENLRLSRRVLEAVRSEKRAVSARTGGGGEAMNLTVVDAAEPRAVFCAPVNAAEDVTDALYLDVPADQAATDMLDYLQAIARQAGFARKSLLLTEARAERCALDQQLALAQKIQRNLAPHLDRQYPGLEVAIGYEPAMWVGGDYCDLWPLEDGRLAFAIGDVCGKGLAAAMVMANLQAALRTTLSFCTDPSHVMEHLNRHLLQNLTEGMFVTLFLGVFDAAGGGLTYVNAGHPPPFHIRPQAAAAEFARPANPPLGMMDEPFEAQAETIAPGSGLLVVTDGITDAMAPDRDRFGNERLCRIVESAAGRSAEELVRRVNKAVTDFRQFLPQHDDATILVLMRRPR